MCEAELWEALLAHAESDEAAGGYRTPRTAWYRGRALLGLRRYEELLRLAAASSVGGALDPLAAVALAEQGMGRAALEKAEAAVSARRSNSEYMLGRVHAALGDEEEALAWYERAGRRFTASVSLRDAARLLARMGDDREAAVAFDRAFRAAGVLHVEDLSTYGGCLRRLGRVRQAEEVDSVLREKRTPPRDS